MWVSVVIGWFGLLLACGAPKDTGTREPVDKDGDGFTEQEDCDDGRAAVYPGASECCNGLDDDCDGTVDEADALDATTWYQDADGDGFGGSSGEVRACEAPAGWVDQEGDCDDGDAAVSPQADELCDGVDDDCDGSVDEDDALDATTWYPDADGDGFGGSSGEVRACQAPTGFTALSGDCDDDQPAVHPEAQEVCGDGLDNDCDGGAGDCLGPWGDISLAEAWVRFRGSSPEEFAGWAVGEAGDVDADGWPDLLIAARNAAGDIGSAAGAVYLFHGPSLAALAGDVSLATADAILLGAAAEDNAGYAIAGPGDLNADGFADLAVGAKLELADAVGGTYIVFGPVSGQRDLSTADICLLGRSADDAAGTNLAAAGDIDGDGLPDLLIGASGESSAAERAGAVYLLPGSSMGGLLPEGDLSLAPTKLLGEAADDAAGCHVGGGGDVDGDGYADLLVGSCGQDAGGSHSGAIYLWVGPVSGEHSLAAAGSKFVGASAGDYASRVANAGDTNADGYDDMFFGAYKADPEGSQTGAVYLVLGAPEVGQRGEQSLSLADARVPGEGVCLGYGLAGGRDVDDDGYADLLAGDSCHEDFRGVSYLLRGPLSGTVDLSSQAARLLGEADADYSGYAVSLLGDVDGDGFAELLMGAYGYDGAGSSAGAAYLVAGGPGL